LVALAESFLQLQWIVTFPPYRNKAKRDGIKPNVKSAIYRTNQIPEIPRANIRSPIKLQKNPITKHTHAQAHTAITGASTALTPCLSSSPAPALPLAAAAAAAAAAAHRPSSRLPLPLQLASSPRHLLANSAYYSFASLAVTARS